MSDPNNTFPIRVKQAVRGTYHSCMRRSLQSIALYEADRCLTARYPDMRPFQRKYALLATAVDLLKTVDFLNDYHRQEIMFRTNASKENLAPELAWRRMKLISREINQTIMPKARELVKKDENSEKSHAEICSMLLQVMYDETTEHKSSKNQEYPPLWEYNHNNVFTVYRMYYRGVVVDPNIFPAIPPRVVEVPTRKQGNDQQATNNVAKGGGDAPSIPLAKMTISPGKGRNNVEMPDGERRAMLKEVKDHTELLKEFEGVIPDEELANRKRALYAALPPVPSPFGLGKKQRKKAVVFAAAAPAVAIKVEAKPVAAAAPAVAIKVETKPVAAAPPAVDIPVATKPVAPAMEEEDWEKLGAYDNKEEPPENFASV